MMEILRLLTNTSVFFFFFSVHQNKKMTVSHRGSIQMRLSVVLTNSVWVEVIYARYPKRLLWPVLARVMKELSVLAPYVTGSLPCWTMLGTDFFFLIYIFGNIYSYSIVGPILTDTHDRIECLVYKYMETLIKEKEIIQYMIKVAFEIRDSQ